MDSAKGRNVILLSSLVGKQVVSQTGHRLGRVDEVHVDDEASVTMLALGRSGWLEREGGKSGRKLVSWERVCGLDKQTITVSDRDE